MVGSTRRTVSTEVQPVTRQARRSAFSPAVFCRGPNRSRTSFRGVCTLSDRAASLQMPGRRSLCRTVRCPPPHGRSRWDGGGLVLFGHESGARTDLLPHLRLRWPRSGLPGVGGRVGPTTPHEARLPRGPSPPLCPECVPGPGETWRKGSLKSARRRRNSQYIGELRRNRPSAACESWRGPGAR